MTADEIAKIMEPVWEGTDSLAEAAFIGSMVRWIGKMGYRISIYDCTSQEGGGCRVRCFHGITEEYVGTIDKFQAPTLFEALAAACVAVGKDTQP